jgi:hypothetical protein
MFVLTHCIILDVLITRRVMSDVLINSFCYIRRCSLPLLYQQTVWQHCVLFVDALINMCYMWCSDYSLCQMFWCTHYVYRRMSSTGAMSSDVLTTLCVILTDALNLNLQRRTIFHFYEIYVLVQVSTTLYGIISQTTVILTPTAMRTSNLIWIRFV